MFTVEGHTSNMFAGPVADTATQLESEGLCHHQPIGYNNAALPFDNDSGIRELARLVGATTMDNGKPFPEGTPWSMGIYSQGAIVGSYFYFRFLQPGQPLAWRTPDLKGVLTYANPCRQTNSVASWAMPWVQATGTHGLDSNQRFGLPGFPAKPDNWVDVYRGGDIFAENGDDQASAIKAAVYNAVMNDWTSQPFSLAGQIAATFHAPFNQVIGVILALISGATFLAGHPNPHYAAFDLAGGRDWMRGRLTSGRIQPRVREPELASTSDSGTRTQPDHESAPTRVELAARDLGAASTHLRSLLEGLTDDDRHKLRDSQMLSDLLTSTAQDVRDTADQMNRLH
jgi:hypothetical protein